MRQSVGQANITVIIIVLIGIVAMVGSVLIPRLANSSIYTSCCNEAGGIWENGYCRAQTPTTCDNREALFHAYDECVMDSGKNNANEKYRAVSCD